MARRTIFAALLLAAAAFSAAAQTWTVDATSVAYNNYAGTAATITTKLRVARSESGSSMPLYLMVYAADPGSAAVGSRKIYKDGISSSSSISIRLRPASGTTEISTLTTSGTKTVASGTMGVSDTSIDITVKVYFPGSTVPAGSYTGTFVFNLYTGYSSYNASAVLRGSGILLATAEAASGTRGLISLYPTNLNFGLMQAGFSYSQTASMSVTGVNNTKVYVSSANSGKLMLSDGSSSIAYTLVVDSSATSPVTITSFPYTSPIVALTGTTTDRLYTIAITTETLDFLDAGDYT
ncbi:hypothetical protein LWX53_04885, partial [bacterium]|nr:hypothetical protein [bacterium]